MQLQNILKTRNILLEYLKTNVVALLWLAIFGNLYGQSPKNSFENLINISDKKQKIAQLERWAYEDLFYKSPKEKERILSEFERYSKSKNDKTALNTIAFYRAFYSEIIDKKNIQTGLEQINNLITKLEKDKEQLQLAYFKHVLGYYYFTSKSDYVQSLRYLLQSHYHFERQNYEAIYDASGMLSRLAYVYYHLDNFNESINYIKKSQHFPFSSTRNQINSLNTIGQSYLELFEPDSARKYFNKSLQLAQQSRDIIWIGIISGNIGKLLINQNKFEKAFPFIKDYYQITTQSKDSILKAEALTSLAKIALSSGNYDQALTHLNVAKKIFLSSDELTLSFEDFLRKYYFLATYSQALDKKGDIKNSLDYLKASNVIRDSIIRRAKQSKNIAINQLFEAEQYNTNYRLLQEEKNSAEQKTKLLIAIGLLMIVILILLIGRQQKERKYQQYKERLINMQRARMESDLLQAKEQLQEYINNFKKKSELLDITQRELKLIKEQQVDTSISSEQLFTKLNKITILTNEDWKRFKGLFEKVHQGFFHRLKETYPTLTPAETRLCALIKLGLSTHEMASMMGISTMGIKKNRQRLRKKINIEEKCRLEELFNDF